MLLLGLSRVCSVLCWLIVLVLVLVMWVCRLVRCVFLVWGVFDEVRFWVMWWDWLVIRVCFVVVCLCRLVVNVYRFCSLK